MNYDQVSPRYVQEVCPCADALFRDQHKADGDSDTPSERILSRTAHPTPRSALLFSAQHPILARLSKYLSVVNEVLYLWFRELGASEEHYSGGREFINSLQNDAWRARSGRSWGPRNAAYEFPE